MNNPDLAQRNIAVGIPGKEPAPEYQNPVKVEPYDQLGFAGAPGVLSSQTTTAAEPPVDPAQTLGRALTEADNIGESSSGTEAQSK